MKSEEEVRVILEKLREALEKLREAEQVQYLFSDPEIFIVVRAMISVVSEILEVE
jgi:hypothetical protein